VYAIEASDMAVHCRKLIESNGLADKITVIQAKLEDIELPESVDTIISEPLGIML
jgi:cyclopropane fatty-acyl-phospholipid synthase-like methyltransferase